MQLVLQRMQSLQPCTPGRAWCTVDCTALAPSQRHQRKAKMTPASKSALLNSPCASQEMRSTLWGAHAMLLWRAQSSKMQSAHACFRLYLRLCALLCRSQRHSRTSRIKQRPGCPRSKLCTTHLLARPLVASAKRSWQSRSLLPTAPALATLPKSRQRMLRRGLSMNRSKCWRLGSQMLTAGLTAVPVRSDTLAYSCNVSQVRAIHIWQTRGKTCQ